LSINFKNIFFLSGNLNEKAITIFNDKTLLLYGTPRKNSLFKLALEEIRLRPDCVSEASNEGVQNDDLFH